MKTKRLLGLLLLILSITGFVACSDDEPQDKVKTVKMLISDKTGTYQPWGSDSPIDCMLVKEESESDYKTLDFQGITDFVYEKGYEYALWVEKRTLVDPPADGSSIVYKLIDVISKAKVEYRCRNRFWTAILVMLIRTKCSILVRGDSVFITMAVVVREAIAVGWTIICNRRRVHRHFMASLPNGRLAGSGIRNGEFVIFGMFWLIDEITLLIRGKAWS